MAKDAGEFLAAFSQLRSLLHPYAPKLVVAEDTETDYTLNASYTMPNRKALYFGSARIGKAYVSYHLMPVYVTPALLADISPALRARMQGKSCFNFTQPDPALFAELKRLTKSGFESYKKAGYV